MVKSLNIMCQMLIAQCVATKRDQLELAIVVRYTLVAQVSFRPLSEWS
mgnify:CR=1 FL=1